MCRAEAFLLPDGENMSDTACIRITEQALAKALYINQRKDCYLQLEQLAVKTGNDALLARCRYELSHISIQQSNYPSTIKYAQRALRYYEAKNDPHGRADCYRIMGTLYLLLSPEHADAYFRKCYELASRKDSADAVINKCVMSVFPISKITAIDEINNINLNVLDDIQTASVNYLYAVVARQAGNIDTALDYALKVDTFLSAIPQLGYMTALNKAELALLYFARGDLRRAEHFLTLSDEICKRDDYRLIRIYNMQLWSDILLKKDREFESLAMFKQHVNMRDSLLGLNEVRSLNELLMRNLLDENVRGYLTDTGNRHQRFYIFIIAGLIAGMVTLYYFGNTFRKRKEKYLFLSRMDENSRQIGSNPELKQHLSVIMFEYKKGLNYCMEQSRENRNSADDFRTLNRNIDEANDYLDRLKKWIDEQPYGENPVVRFNAREIIGKLIQMFEIAFAPKQASIRNNIETDTIICGSQIYFSIAFEILLFKLLENSGDRAVVAISARDGHDFTVFTVASPNYVITDEERATLLGLIQKMRANIGKPIPLETDNEICLKCIYETGGSLWFESAPEQGTTLNFSIPKRRIGKG